MGLFNFFKRKKEAVKPEPINPEPINNDINQDNLNLNVEYSERQPDDQEHGEIIASLFGHELVINSPEKIHAIVDRIIDHSIKQKAISENPIYKICEADFTMLGANNNNLKIRTVYVLRSAGGTNFPALYFPYLSTKRTTPFETKKIITLKNGAKFTAEVVGTGKSTFGVGFFATDFSYKRKEYSKRNLNVRISAFAFVIDKSTITEIGGTPIAPDFCTYIPVTDSDSNSNYHFIGMLLNFEEVFISKDISGYLMEIDLINLENENNFFTVDVFVNKGNMQIEELENGMRLCGVLQFQGELI